MRIILIGYMGSGKTTVGKALSAKLNVPFLDLDEYIELVERKTIKELFEVDGQIQFRKKEHAHLSQLIRNKDNLVLATGGGAPCYSGNMKTILEITPNVFYLQVSISELVARLLPEQASRPLIAQLTEEEMPGFLGKHLFERNNFYMKAHHTIACDGKSISDITLEIKGLLV